MDVLYHPETKYLDHYIEIADAIELAFPSVVVRGNEKDAAADDDGHVAEEEEEDYFRVECEDETIAETTAGGRLPRLEDIVEALEKKVTEKEEEKKKDFSSSGGHGGCG